MGDESYENKEQKKSKYGIIASLFQSSRPRSVSRNEKVMKNFGKTPDTKRMRSHRSGRSAYSSLSPLDADDPESEEHVMDEIQENICDDDPPPLDHLKLGFKEGSSQSGGF